MIEPSDWGNLQKLIEILGVLKEATTSLSGVYYPTSSLFLVHACNILGVLMKYRHDDDETVRQAVFEMITKWLQYYTTFPSTYIIATLLDPFQKSAYLEAHLETYYGLVNTFWIEQTEWSQSQDGPYEHIDYKTHFENHLTLAKKLYELYDSVYSSNSSSSSSGSFATSSHGLRKGKHHGSLNPTLFPSFAPKRKSIGDGFQHYLQTEVPTQHEYTILEWWKNFHHYFPIVAIMARHFLSVPASTVAVEQIFSLGGNIMTESRASMGPTTLECLACVADWHKAAQRSQEEGLNDSMNNLSLTDASSSSTTAVNSNDELFEEQ